MATTGSTTSADAWRRRVGVSPYTSDHGGNVGVRGMSDKSTRYDEAAGVPLILAGPHVPKGKVCRTPASLVDFAPTILEAVGAEARAGAQPARTLAFSYRRRL
jgi:choline-sulfatase